MTIGLRRGAVRIEPYHAEWNILFEEEAVRIQRAIGIFIEDIQHIGSTSVIGLASKPIIDIAVAVRSSADIGNCVNPLIQIGYQYFGDRENRGDYFFAKGTDEHRTHYLHLVIADSMNWQRYIVFRDMLSSSLDLQEQYTALKQSLASVYTEDRQAYTKMKECFIRKVIENKKIRDEQNARDIEIINRRADFLNREAEDVLEYQKPIFDDETENYCLSKAMDEGCCLLK